jgi:hypothetical protein
MSVMVFKDAAQSIAAVAQKMSGKEIALLRSPPLRTVRAVE